MRKKMLLLMIILMVVGLTGCNSVIEDKQYQVNSVFSYGSYEKDENKTEVSYRLEISGTKEDVANISKCKLIVEKEYQGLVLDRSKETVAIISGQSDEAFLRVEGSIVFDMKDKNKEEISEMELFKSVEIKGKDNETFTYKLNQ